MNLSMTFCQMLKYPSLAMLQRNPGWTRERVKRLKFLTKINPLPKRTSPKKMKPTFLKELCLFRTFICTLDSLGSKHPKAIKTLNRYLQLEAENKKKTTNTSDAVGKLVQVPLQPNFSDCGIYLLHFARIFVSKPDYFCKLPGRSRPQEERMTDWEGHGLGDARENLRKRILELSEEWKRERATKEKEQAVKEGQGEVDVVPDSDSDDDAVIIETTPPEASTSTPNNKRGGKAGRGKRAKGRGPISRPRG
ncbi:hypothetical protein K435DRAFT_116251 [Dendrothele bispora CBS 962.96]|uniref:Ubiquitin-like protease family profile domain-containing protein n=1 Tax=Dendrothele bispora (strain CBS 962.96) TaxID=1314807 RepID=A0A4S8MQG9_DENBC|nr:hypothetical protein K435DRAFT_116251 [Dendrothele bispora CBS 962.96]